MSRAPPEPSGSDPDPGRGKPRPIPSKMEVVAKCQGWRSVEAVPLACSSKASLRRGMPPASSTPAMLRHEAVKALATPGSPGRLAGIGCQLIAEGSYDGSQLAQRMSIVKVIIYHLRPAAGDSDVRLAQSREMLRDDGLAQAHLGHECRHRPFLMLEKAQQDEAIRMRADAQDCRHVGGSRARSLTTVHSGASLTLQFAVGNCTFLYH